MTENFVLHPRLEADTIFVTDWELSRVLLMNDARFPWLILVPRRAGVSELYDLSSADRGLLIEEASHAAKALKELIAAEKINVGSLGNLVPQLHVHVVARRRDDAAWPAPVWGSRVPVPYEIGAAEVLGQRLLGHFSAPSAPAKLAAPSL